MNTSSEMAAKLLVQEYRSSFVESQINMGLPFKIKALRKQRNWTQPQLAERAGMKQSRISAIEKPGGGKLNIDTLCRLAAAFDVALDVQFIPFGELIRRSDNFDPDSFTVRSFNEELAEDELAAQDKAAQSKLVDLQKTAAAKNPDWLRHLWVSKGATPLLNLKLPPELQFWVHQATAADRWREFVRTEGEQGADAYLDTVMGGSPAFLKKAWLLSGAALNSSPIRTPTASLQVEDEYLDTPQSKGAEALSIGVGDFIELPSYSWRAVHHIRSKSRRKKITDQSVISRNQRRGR